MPLSPRQPTVSSLLKTGMGCTGGLGHHLEEAEDLCAWTLHENPPACPSRGSGQGTPLLASPRNLRTPGVGGLCAKEGRCLQMKLWRCPVATVRTTSLNNSGVSLGNVRLPMQCPQTAVLPGILSGPERELGLLRPPGPECHPVLALGLPLPKILPRFVPKNSPSVLHDATQPVVRTFAVP